MERLMNFIIRFIFEAPIIGPLAYQIVNYLDTLNDKKAVKALGSYKARTVQVVQKNLLYEGLRRVKSGLKADYSIDQLKRGIRDVEISNYAKGSNEKLAKTLEKAYVYHGTDIKNEVDRARVANKRVEDYRELQNNVLQRRLIREIRNTSDPTKKAELQTEFNRKYLRRDK